MELTNPSQSDLVRTSSPKLHKNLLRLEDALRVVAQLVSSNAGYIPVFERLENEIANINRQFDVIKRAQMLKC